MKKHHKIEIEGESIYLRKSFLGWGIIYPHKVDGKINWKNLIASGSWIKLIILTITILIILGCIYEYSNTLRVANDCLGNSIQWIT